jgi:competence protein ComEC
MPHEGDILLVETSIHRGDTLGDFDYGMYLRRQGIVGTAWAHRGNWQIVGHQPIKGIKAMAQQCQQFLHKQYQKMGVDGKELGIMSALTLGYREELDRDVQQSFSASGAMHVLAVSGLHTGIVWSILVWLLTLGGRLKPLYHERWKRYLTSAIIILLLWGYAFITGLSPSVMRSALMLSFLECSFLLKQRTSRWNPVLAAAVIILVFNPLSLWSISFQLSFAAVIGIMLIGHYLQSKINTHNTILQYIVGLVVVSIAAQVATLPLTLHYFGQTSNYFALTNLVVIPMAYLLLLLGFGTLATSWCFLGKWLGTAAQFCTYCMREVVEWIEHLPYSTSRFYISTWDAIGLYGAIVCGILLMRDKKVHWWWLLGVIGSLSICLVNRI